MMPTDLQSASGIRTATPLWRRAAPIVATAAATALIVTAIAIWRTPAPVPPPAAVRSLHVPPSSAPLVSTISQPDLAISPDGRTLVYGVGTSGAIGIALYIRPLDQIDAVPLRGAMPAVAPFFSPTGEWVGFLDQVNQAQIRKVSVLGGPPVTVTTAASTVLGTTWTTDGIIFGTRGGPLHHVPDAGGDPVAVTVLDAAAGETDHMWPAAVPGTPVVLFAAVTGNLASTINGQLAALDRSTGTVTRFKLEGFHPRYLSSGHIVYATADGSLRAVAFDAGRMAITGTPVPVLESVGVKTSGAANFDISATGHLVHSGAGSVGVSRTITWVDRNGRETPIAAPARNYFYVRVSPDGSRLSLDVRDQEQDIWMWDVKREALARLTDRPGNDQYGLWTPDQRVVFSSAAGGRTELFRHRPDGVGQPEQITDTAADKLQPFPNAITPDGRQVIFRAAVGGPKNDLFIADMAGDKKVRPLFSSEHDERNAALSPDGAFIAFESDVTGGRYEVFVRPFPKVNDGQSKVSVEGGDEPVWAPDGRELFYVAGNKLMAVPVTTSGGLQLGKPVPLFDTLPYFFGGAGRNYDVARDGKRFVMVKNPVGEQGRSLPITIVLNWVEELRARIK